MLKKFIAVIFTVYLLKYEPFYYNLPESKVSFSPNSKLDIKNDVRSDLSHDKTTYVQLSNEKIICLHFEVVENNQNFDLDLLLNIKGGDQKKFGPGPRAKADAFRNVNAKRLGSSLIPGASGFVPQDAYNIYHKNTRLGPSPQTVVSASKNDGMPSRGAPPLSTGKPNRATRMESQPLRIKSEHQESEVLITKKDIKKWMSPEQKKNKETSNQKVEDQFVDTVKAPNEVLDGNHIHHGQKNCKVYIKYLENNAGNQEKLAVIVDVKTGRASLGSILSDKEYENLKQTGEIDLFDLKREPQTLVMDEKGIQEADVLNRAKEEGCLTGILDVRRPYNLTESRTDFVGKDSSGSKVEIDVKGVRSGAVRPLDTQTQEINQNIKDLFNSVDDPTKLQIVCDLGNVPKFLKDTVIRNITSGFDSNQLNNINFVYNK